MKEDILEQLVDDYLKHEGYFARHNLRFKPHDSSPDFNQHANSVHSDIDVIAVNPRRSDVDRVRVLSCKAWQSGFNPAAKVTEIECNKIISGREAWKGFRELCIPKWSEAFLHAVEDATGTRKFVYCTVVTVLLNPGSRADWEENLQFRKAIEGNQIQIVTLSEMLDRLWLDLNKNSGRI